MADLNKYEEHEMEILVVDDEEMMRSLLTLSLTRLGFKVTTAAGGQEALRIFDPERFALVVLDVIMPEMNGFELCREIRKRSDLPILMLTALSRTDDIVQGLELGADNYITKPFTFKEVEAKIRALLRRMAAQNERHSFDIMEAGDLRLANELREVTVANELIHLTPTEYQLLHHLLTNKERPVSKDDLLISVWGYEEAIGGSNLVELAIRRLRLKIEDSPSKPKRLLTVRGVGYKLCAATSTRVVTSSHRMPANINDSSTNASDNSKSRTRLKTSPNRTGILAESSLA